MHLQFPIPANHAWPLSCEPSACHSPCPPLTPITAEDFEQLDTSSSHWVPCQCPPKSVGVWLLCLMRTRWGSFVTVRATCKGRQGTAGSRSPPLLDLISAPHQCVKGFVRNYKPIMTGNWDYSRTASNSTWMALLNWTAPRIIQESTATSCCKVWGPYQDNIPLKSASHA